MQMKETVSRLWYKVNKKEYYKFSGKYFDLMQRSIELFPSLDKITLEFRSFQALIDNYQIFTNPNFKSYFDKFWVHEKDKVCYRKKPWSKNSFDIKAKGIIILAFQSEIKVMRAESIKISTCCNKRTKYIDEFLIVDTKTKISNAVDITDQYSIDESTAEVISQCNNSALFEGFWIIQQANIIDITIDNDNIDFIKTLESIKSLKIFIRKPKSLNLIRILSKSIGTSKNKQDMKLSVSSAESYSFHKYRNLLLVLYRTNKLFK